MKHSDKVTRLFFLSAFTLLSSQLIAGPGTQSNSPLVVGTAATPNIMLVVDNSRSMEHVAEESVTSDPDKYNKNTTYIDNCTTAVSSSQKVYIFVDSDGDPKVRYSHTSGTEYTVAYNASNKTTGDICFAPTTNYSAGIHATSGTQPQFDFTALYTGNYLNWYFTKDNTSNSGGSVGTDWDSAQRIKPGTKTRKTIAEESISSLVTALEVSDVDIRLGLASFNSASSGAKIFDEVKFLDTTQRDSINSNMTSLGYGYGTPLAETLHQVGRYFLGENGSTNPGNLPVGSSKNAKNGQYNGNLILHPDATTPVTEDDDVTLNRDPRNADSNRESPIQYWCQNNFAVVMTDGLPTVDGDVTGEIPASLQDYDTDCDGASPACDTRDRKTSGGYLYELDIFNPSDYFDDVAQALYEIDLRPDIDDYDGNEVKNNILTYTIAFADQDAVNNLLIKDAGNQGGGEAISAKDGGDLINKFTEVTNKILATTSSAASVSFNTGTLTNNSALYQALFTTSRWSGDIRSYPVSPTSGDINFTCTLDATNCWSAADHVDELAYDDASQVFDDNREIITYKRSENKAIPFARFASGYTYSATLPANGITADMVKDICAGPEAPTLEGTGDVCAYSDTDPTAADNSAANAAASKTYINQVIDYIRGDRTYEDINNSPTFRTRQSVLGDIVHSSPAFVGAPSQGWPSIEETTNKFGVTGNRYSDYKTAKASRTKMLYVAANDGMLHGFRTNTLSTSVREKAGDELFAFIPSFLFSPTDGEGLHYLTQPNYEHKYYLDLSPTITDYYGRTKDSTDTTTYSTSTDDWHTVLIAGSRGGVKKGIFAMDISAPLTITESNTADKILWEFTNADDVDLGFTYSRPTVAMTNAVKGGVNRWAAIFGNGYQNDGSTPPTGVSCTASLFVVFLDGGLDGIWTKGTDPNTADYMKIDTEVGTNSAGNCNGLSTPALHDTDGDSILDRVYAGDVQGNMWAFDLTCGASGCGSSDFNVAYKQGTNPKPLFTAKGPISTTYPSGHVQPIMIRPAVATNTSETTTSSNAPNLLVLFGTGQYHTVDDYQPTAKINTIYAIWDNGTGKLTDDRSNSSASSSTLVQQFIYEEDSSSNPLVARDPVSLEEFPVRINSSNTVDYSSKYGWFIDLNAADSANNFAEERLVVDLTIRKDVVFFNTAIPNSQVCGAGGEGWLMGFNFVDGGEPASPVFDSNRNGAIDDSDNATVGNVVTGVKIGSIPTSSTYVGDYKYTQGSDKNIDKIKVDPGKGLREGRLSWRELRPE